MLRDFKLADLAARKVYALIWDQLIRDAPEVAAQHNKPGAVTLNLVQEKAGGPFVQLAVTGRPIEYHQALEACYLRLTGRLEEQRRVITEALPVVFRAPGPG